MTLKILTMSQQKLHSKLLTSISLLFQRQHKMCNHTIWDEKCENPIFSNFRASRKNTFLTAKTKNEKRKTKNEKPREWKEIVWALQLLIFHVPSNSIKKLE